MTRIAIKVKEALFSGTGIVSTLEYLIDKKILGTENCQVKSLFSTLNSEKLEELTRRAKALDSGYQPINFSSFQGLECENKETATILLQRLRSDKSFLWAYMEDNYSIGPNFISEKKPIACNQGYLYNAPEGIGVSHAWKRKGGRGDSSIKFVDIEQGWLFDHESLNLQRIPDTGINYSPARDHGAGVMGIIMMRDGGSGGIGITPQVKGSVMSLYRPDGIFNIPDAIVSALQFLDAGDILLLECQVLDADNSHQLWPVEVREANFDAIRLATALGITVIEPSGNGNIKMSCGNCLDDFSNQFGQKVFDTGHIDYMDSGAIIVAAASCDVPHRKMYFTNYGTRINCFAWGEKILTAGLYPKSSGMANNTYTRQFGGTSGAAAIVAGVAIALQSMMEANYQCRLFPKQMREILGSLSNGTESAEGIEKDLIGVMPDLEKIATKFVDKFDGRMDVIRVNCHGKETSMFRSQSV